MRAPGVSVCRGRILNSSRPWILYLIVKTLGRARPLQVGEWVVLCISCDLDRYKSTITAHSPPQFRPKDGVKLLLVGAADLRHVMRTLEKAKQHTSRPLHVSRIPAAAETVFKVTSKFLRRSFVCKCDVNGGWRSGEEGGWRRGRGFQGVI